MAFGGFDNKSGGGGHAVSEINMVPLIDVMLVLLVIFIITAPLLAHSIKINIPQVSAEQIEEDPKVVDLAIDPAGTVFFNEERIDIESLQARFAALAPTKPQPEIRIRADQNTRYETLAQVMGAARRGGMQRIGFVTSPQPSAAGSVPPAAASASPNNAAASQAAPTGGASRTAAPNGAANRPSAAPAGGNRPAGAAAPAGAGNGAAPTAPAR